MLMLPWILLAVVLCLWFFERHRLKVALKNEQSIHQKLAEQLNDQQKLLDISSGIIDDITAMKMEITEPDENRD